MKRTPLYDEHVRLGARMVPFAGWEMPVWYTSILEEHAAVRGAAGLFDVGHMGVLEIEGPDAPTFLEAVTTSLVSRLSVGQCKYSYILGFAGLPVDDIIIYRRGEARFMLVVNASNTDKAKEWLDSVNSPGFVKEEGFPFAGRSAQATIRDLKEPSSGGAQRVDLAFQGPKSLAVLERVIADAETYTRLSELRRFRFLEVGLPRFEAIISRTGYTGEPLGFELYIHTDAAVDVWRRILEAGQELRVKPAGLGARDSTRTEAGLPLYGHELAGEHEITPLGAGYGYVVKFEKPYFIGKKALLERESERKMEVVRFRTEGKRGPVIHGGDPVVNMRGYCIGKVTSCVPLRGYQIGMAYLDRRDAVPGTKIRVFPLSRREDAPPEKPKEELQPGDRVTLPMEATIISHFSEPGELQAEG